MTELASLHKCYSSDNFVRSSMLWPQVDEWKRKSGSSNPFVGLDTAPTGHLGYVISPSTLTSPIIYNMKLPSNLSARYGASVDLVTAASSLNSSDSIGVCLYVSNSIYYVLLLDGQYTLSLRKYDGGFSSLASTNLGHIDISTPLTLRLSFNREGVGVRRLEGYVNGVRKINMSQTSSENVYYGGIRIDSKNAQLHKWVFYGDNSYNYLDNWLDFYLTNISVSTSPSANIVKIPKSSGIVQVGSSVSRSYQVSGYMTASQTNISNATSLLRDLSHKNSHVYLRHGSNFICGNISNLNSPKYVYKGRKKIAKFSFDIQECFKPR